MTETYHRNSHRDLNTGLNICIEMKTIRATKE